MPCAPVKARLLIKQGKAKVVRRYPFTIKLLFGSSGYKQEVVAGMDTGSKTIGSAAIANGHVIYQAEVALRDDVSVQKDYYNVKAYVLHRDGYTCQSGRKCQHSAKLHVHHIIFRSQRGSDAPWNLVTLCETCHDDLHAEKFVLNGTRSQTKHATEVGIIKGAILRLAWLFETTFRYETKFKREQCLGWPKGHAADAVAICCGDGKIVVPNPTVYHKRHVAKGDYQQTSGKRSEKRIPTGKLFGLRKFDLVSTPRGVGFVKGKRTSGYFAIAAWDGASIHASAKALNCKRISARSTTLIGRGKARGKRFLRHG